jgi:hypothetical protein
VGHEDQFPSPSLNGRWWSGEATFAGMGGKEDDAPIPAVPVPTIGRLKSTLRSRSLDIATLGRSLAGGRPAEPVGPSFAPTG